MRKEVKYMENKKRGLANADEETKQRVSSQGGKAVSQDTGHMSEIGRKGGKASHSGRRSM